MKHQSSKPGSAPATAPIAMGIQLGSACYRLTYLSPESSSPATMLDSFGNETTPAYFALDGDTALYGDDARNFACINPRSCVKGITKSFDGTSTQKRSKNITVDGNKRNAQFLFNHIQPEEVLIQTVHQLLDGTKGSFEQPFTITSIVASVSHCALPAVANLLEKAWTAESRQSSSVPKFIVVPKTTAAFVGYAMSRETCDDGLHAVLFIGASVSELALCKVAAQTMTLKGDILSYSFGGDHFDEVIQRDCRTEFEKQNRVEWENYPGALQRLEMECQKAKDRLSAAKIVVIEIPRFIDDVKLRVQVRRSEVEHAVDGQVTAFSSWLVGHLNPVKSSLKGILLAGGASRIPILQNEINRLFPGLVKSSAYSCAHVLVSNGCAYLARYISGLASEDLPQVRTGCLQLNAIRAAKVSLAYDLAHTIDSTGKTACLNQLQPAFATATKIPGSELVMNEPEMRSAESGTSDATLTDTLYTSDYAEGCFRAGKETCTDGQPINTTMISDRCRSLKIITVSEGHFENKDGGVGFPTVALKEPPKFRQLCSAEECIRPRNSKQQWMTRLKYDAELFIYKCETPGSLRYLFRLIPYHTETEPIWLSLNQITNVQRGNKATVSTFEVSKSDPRGCVHLNEHELFVKLCFPNFSKREPFHKAVSDCI